MNNVKPARSSSRKKSANLDYTQILSAVPHPIIVIDDDNNITYANAATELFYQHGIAQLRKLKIEDLLPFGCPVPHRH